jgi:hypothetical protein
MRIPGLLALACLSISIPVLAGPSLDAPGPGYRQMKEEEASHSVNVTVFSPEGPKEVLIQVKTPLSAKRPEAETPRLLESEQPLKLQLSKSAPLR